MRTLGISRFFNVIGKWIVGIGFVYLIFAYLELSEIVAVITRADKKYLVAGFLVIVIIRIFYAWQTALAVRHQGVRLGTLRAFVVITISGFYALFLPGGISGGAVKWYKFSKPTGKRAEVLAAIIFIRLFNTMVFLVLGMCGLLIENPTDSKWFFGATLFSLVFLTLLYVFLFSNKLRGNVRKSPKSGPFQLPIPIRKMLANLSHSLSRYHSIPARKFWTILIIPVVNLIFTVLLFHLVARSLDIYITLYALPWIVSMVYLIQMIPLSISGLGLREGALVLTLPYYGVNPAAAMVFSLTLFGYLLFMGLIGGVLEMKEFIHRSDSHSP